MIESDARLVEPIVGGSATGIRARAQTQTDRAIAEEDAGGKIHDELESDDLGVKRPAALDVRDGQAEMMNGAGGDRCRHDETLHEKVKAPGSMGCSDIMRVSSV